MKRMAIIFSVLAVGMLILGLVEDLTNFKWAAGDQNPFFGNPNWTLNDGKVALILGGFLVIASALILTPQAFPGSADRPPGEFAYSPRPASTIRFCASSRGFVT